MWSASSARRAARRASPARRGPRLRIAADLEDLIGRRLRRRRSPASALARLPQRRLARQHRAGAPARVAAACSCSQLDQHAGADERALAAAEIAVHDDEVLLDHAGAMISSVIGSRPKKIGHSALERAQPRIGRGRQLDVEEVRGGRGGDPGHATSSSCALASSSQDRTWIGQSSMVQSIQPMRRFRAFLSRRGVRSR